MTHQGLTDGLLLGWVGALDSGGELLPLLGLGLSCGDALALLLRLRLSTLAVRREQSLPLLDLCLQGIRLSL